MFDSGLSTAFVFFASRRMGKAEADLLIELSEDREFDNTWNNFSSLEQLIVLEISFKNAKLYVSAAATP